MTENISVIFRGEFANFRTPSTTDSYFVGFDSEHYTELLRQKGMQDDDIQTLTLEVCKGNFRHKKETEGIYYPEERIISLFTDQKFADYERCLRAATDIALGIKKPQRIKIGGKVLYEDNPFKGILYTKRLVGYLQKAPQERGLAFAERIILRGVNRNLNSALLHETKHALDKVSGDGIWLRDVLFSLGLVAGAWVGFDMGRNLFDLPLVVNIIKEFIFAGAWGLSGLGVGYYLEPKERSARKFASELKNHPNHRGLIGIGPRIPRTPSSS